MSLLRKVQDRLDLIVVILFFVAAGAIVGDYFTPFWPVALLGIFFGLWLIVDIITDLLDFFQRQPQPQNRGWTLNVIASILGLLLILAYFVVRHFWPAYLDWPPSLKIAAGVTGLTFCLIMVLLNLMFDSSPDTVDDQVKQVEKENSSTQGQPDPSVFCSPPPPDQK